jgi:uncharacterized protein
MTEGFVYVAAGIGLAFANITAWIAACFGLPGTWVIVALTALACHFLPERGSLGVAWSTVAVLAVLAVFAELWETGAAVAAAKRAGASRRGASFAMLGAIAGSILGAIVGAPIPVIGSMVAAIVGAAGGAFAGAWIGEGRTGRPMSERVAVGTAAATGRVWGVVGKLAIGLVMVIVATGAYFL